MDYRLEDQWAVGAIVDYSAYSNTGRSLRHRYSEFPCISGGNRQLSSAAMRMKYYVASGGRTEVYVAGTLGVVNINRRDAVYGSPNGPYVVAGYSSINLQTILAAGIESVIFPRLSFTMEAGIGLVEDDFILDRSLPARAGIRFTL
jgi:hypothetical protein